MTPIEELDLRIDVYPGIVRFLFDANWEGARDFVRLHREQFASDGYQPDGLMLDEAHRGMKASGGSSAEEKPTIVKRLINGTGSVPGIPIVWGISTTVNRFNTAMADVQNRATLPNVMVGFWASERHNHLRHT
jgi:hypothetical protein